MTSLHRQAVDGSRRPVIPGCYPDPSICRVGSRYFLANSSFEWFPAVPIWQSNDLIKWEFVGNALNRPEQFPPGVSLSSEGIFAPTLRFHEGRFWLITTIVGESTRHVLYSAAEDWFKDPAYAWSDPIFIDQIGGIDPDLAWDEKGNCYLTCCTSAPGQYAISQARIDLSTGHLLEQPRVVWNGTGLQWPEGPHLYQIGDWWYLLIAEGGTERGHVVSVARSKSPEGPFQSHPNNPIFTHRSTDHPVFSVGHADLVPVGDDDWAMVYLGIRPRGALPGFHVNGRETYLAGVEWVDGWPVVVEDRFQIPEAETKFREVFDSPPGTPLHPRWISPGFPPATVASFTGESLNLVNEPSTSGAPSGLGFRVCDDYWTFEALVLAEGAPALRLRLDESHWYQVGVINGEAYAKLQVGPASLETTLEVEGSECTLILRSIPAHSSHSPGPDTIELALRDESGEHLLLSADGRYLSTEVAGGFIGRIVLLHADGCETSTEVASVKSASYFGTHQ